MSSGTKRGIPRAVRPEEVPVYDDLVDFEPMDDFCLLELHEVDETRGGLIIPEAARENHMPYWTVLKVGPGRISTNGTLVPLRVQVGQRVLFTDKRGFVASVPDQAGRPKQVMAAESSIIAIVTDRQVLQ